MGTTRNALARGSFIVFLVASSFSLAGCGEPGPASPGIGLGRDSSGQLVLLGTTCSAELQRIEIGDGSDWSADAGTTITPDSETAGRYQVNLPEVQSPFAESPDMTAEPTVPFFVRVTSSEGVQSQAFGRLPIEGEAIFMDPGGSAPTVHSLNDFPPAGYCAS